VQHSRLKHLNSDERSSAKTPFREWMEGDFDTWQDRVKGRNAAVEVLLPMGAIAIGMTAFAIVLHFTEDVATPTAGECLPRA
jgi:hypothetical protein